MPPPRASRSGIRRRWAALAGLLLASTVTGSSAFSDELPAPGPALPEAIELPLGNGFAAFPFSLKLVPTEGGFQVQLPFQDDAAVAPQPLPEPPSLPDLESPPQTAQ